MQGGTCIIVGDDWAKIAETEELARRHLGCLTFRNSLYYRREGHQQVRAGLCLTALTSS
jgi:hypothetical protein